MGYQIICVKTTNSEYQTATINGVAPILTTHKTPPSPISDENLSNLGDVGLEVREPDIIPSPDQYSYYYKVPDEGVASFLRSVGAGDESEASADSSADSDAKCYIVPPSLLGADGSVRVDNLKTVPQTNTALLADLVKLASVTMDPNQRNPVQRIEHHLKYEDTDGETKSLNEYVTGIEGQLSALLSKLTAIDHIETEASGLNDLKQFLKEDGRDRCSFFDLKSRLEQADVACSYSKLSHDSPVKQSIKDLLDAMPSEDQIYTTAVGAKQILQKNPMLFALATASSDSQGDAAEGDAAEGGTDAQDSVEGYAAAPDGVDKFKLVSGSRVNVNGEGRVVFPESTDTEQRIRLSDLYLVNNADIEEDVTIDQVMTSPGKSTNNNTSFYRNGQLQYFKKMLGSVLCALGISDLARLNLFEMLGSAAIGAALGHFIAKPSLDISVVLNKVKSLQAEWSNLPPEDKQSYNSNVTEYIKSKIAEDTTADADKIREALEGSDDNRVLWLSALAELPEDAALAITTAIGMGLSGLELYGFLGVTIGICTFVRPQSFRYGQLNALREVLNNLPQSRLRPAIPENVTAEGVNWSLTDQDGDLNAMLEALGMTPDSGDETWEILLSRIDYEYSDVIDKLYNLFRPDSEQVASSGGADTDSLLEPLATADREVGASNVSTKDKINYLLNKYPTPELFINEFNRLIGRDDTDFSGVKDPQGKIVTAEQLALMLKLHSHSTCMVKGIRTAFQPWLSAVALAGPASGATTLLKAAADMTLANVPHLPASIKGMLAAFSAHSAALGLMPIMAAYAFLPGLRDKFRAEFWLLQVSMRDRLFPNDLQSAYEDMNRANCIAAMVLYNPCCLGPLREISSSAVADVPSRKNLFVEQLKSFFNHLLPLPLSSGLVNAATGGYSANLLAGTLEMGLTLVGAVFVSRKVVGHVVDANMDAFGENIHRCMQEDCYREILEQYASDRNLDSCLKKLNEAGLFEYVAEMLMADAAQLAASERGGYGAHRMFANTGDSGGPRTSQGRETTCPLGMKLSATK